ncbi:MAG: response regulator transcription factor [Pseudomonadota bacterium]
MSQGPHILIVDDDPHIRDVIRIALDTQGMCSAEASTGKAALTEFARGTFDLIVLDIGMPQMNGFDVCKAVRRTSQVPILFLTAQDEEVELILGFELGADDFVGKPFSPRELMLRIKAILARGKPAPTQAIELGRLRAVPNRHQAWIDDTELVLTGTEFSLLLVLLRHKDQVFDRNRLIDAAYGGHAQLSGRTVDSHIRNIRAKAADLGCDDIIETVHGVGVRMGACAR